MSMLLKEKCFELPAKGRQWVHEERRSLKIRGAATENILPPTAWSLTVGTTTVYQVITASESGTSATRTNGLTSKVSSCVLCMRHRCRLEAYLRRRPCGNSQPMKATVSASVRWSRYPRRYISRTAAFNTDSKRRLLSWISTALT